jgi:hypothetical protein
VAKLARATLQAVLPDDPPDRAAFRELPEWGGATSQT